MNREQLDVLTGHVLSSGMAVHTALGPGLLESAGVTSAVRRQSVA